VAGIDLFLHEVATAPHRDVQFVPRAERLDLTWGHPDPTLLPAAELATAAEAVLGERGWRALSYGTSEGSGRLRHALAERLGATTADEVVLTYGSSGALDLVLGVAGAVGDVVLVEQPTYFLARGIIVDRGLRAVGLPPGAGPATALPDAVARLRADGHRGRTFLYVCPTHANPTGRTLGQAERRDLVTVAAAHDVTIVEDDVYSELGTDPVTPLWALDPERVVRLGSFSKTIAPGLRLGFVRAPAPLAAGLAASGVLDSGGGANPLVAAVVAELIGTGAYDAVVARLGATYRRRMAVLLAPIGDAHLPAGRPTGGYFAWVEGADGLVERAAAAGVAVAPAAPFHVDPVDGRAARVSVSLLDDADLAEAGARLADAVTGPTGSGGPQGRS
jgi:DNA-binding transcriptional MocR family regulator